MLPVWPATPRIAFRAAAGRATIFGTTGEGPSVGAAERDRVANELIGLGFPADRLVEGVIACSPEEAATSTSQALSRGASAVLLAPPFYFRPAPDDAVFEWYAAVFEAVGQQSAGHHSLSHPRHDGRAAFPRRHFHASGAFPRRHQGRQGQCVRSPRRPSP